MNTKDYEQIKKLENKIINKKKFTHTEIDKFMKQIFILKSKNINNTKYYIHLEHLEDILQYNTRKLNSLKMTIISLLGTIFVPIGIMVGYFGMNFKSMGNLTGNKGILSIMHSEKYIFVITILISILFGLFYNIHFY